MPPTAAFPAIQLASAEAALSRWRDYAASELAPAATMSALSLEGFLTALHVCPRDLDEAVWLFRIWGDGSPAFRDADQSREVLGLMLSIRDGIAARLALGRDHYRPMWMPVSGLPDLDDVRQWVAGFWKVVTLCPDWWLDMLDDRKASKTTLPFLGFIPGSDGQCMEETDDNRDQLFDHASYIGIAVLILDRQKKKRAASAASNPARNARCPCGSGRKFKHCCA